MTTLPLETLDVRSVPPVMRHATIFRILERLEPGEAFRIVNDHDPAPLYRKIQARWPGSYSWTYIVAGPVAWQIEIGRREDPADGADCGGHDDSHACSCGH